MSDDAFYSHWPEPPSQKSAEHLFDFVRASDRAAMSCRLKFHGESYGWEALFYANDEFLIGRRFIMRAQAIEWAHDERKAMEAFR